MQQAFNAVVLNNYGQYYKKVKALRHFLLNCSGSQKYVPYKKSAGFIPTDFSENQNKKCRLCEK